MTAKKDTVIATVTRADGSVMEIRALQDLGLVEPGRAKRHRVRRDMLAPQEARTFDAEIPVVDPETGKVVGYKTEERKTAAILGKIPLSRLDLSRYAR
jgi:hypothetical protein